MPGAFRIGAHVGGGLTGIPDNARRAGADTLQMFCSNPRGWAETAVSDDADAAFRGALAERDIAPLFIHAPYLVNVASPDETFYAKSIRNATWTMRRAHALGATGVVVHAGAGGPTTPRLDALARARDALLRIVDDAPGDALLVVELTAGGANTIASRWPQAGELLEAVDRHPRIRFCFDTCHAHSAGYDLSGVEGASACWDELDSSIGIDRLALVHANDSRDPSGSRRDRHAHVGDGTIGLAGFRALLAHPLARRVPWIVETPPDRNTEDVARLRTIASSG